MGMDINGFPSSFGLVFITQALHLAVLRILLPTEVGIVVMIVENRCL